MNDKILKVHHLNCATLCPLGVNALLQDFSKFGIKTPGFLSKFGEGSLPSRLVCHCLLIETNAKLILIDTGISKGDILNPSGRLPMEFLKLLGRPLLDINETAYEQIKVLGYKPENLTDIIVSHLDIDHIGGLVDFPNAVVHVMESELAIANSPKTYLQKHRYVKKLWNHGPKWKTYEKAGERWNGFHAVKNLKGITDEILLIPLRGHTQGHSGVAVNFGEKQYFFTGDAYMNKLQLQGKTPLEVVLFNKLIQENMGLYRENLQKIIQLKEKNVPGLEIFSSHDPDEFHHCCQK